jgi:hypothetical protein
MPRVPNLRKPTNSLLLLTILSLAMPRFAGAASEVSPSIESQLQNERAALAQRRAAVDELKDALAHAEKVSDVAMRISVPLMIIGTLSSAGLFLTGIFGDSADGYLNSLAEKTTTGYGERIAYESVSMMVLSVSGGQVAIYLNQSQRTEISTRISAAEERLKKDQRVIDEDIGTANP